MLILFICINYVGRPLRNVLFIYCIFLSLVRLFLGIFGGARRGSHRPIGGRREAEYKRRARQERVRYSLRRELRVTGAYYEVFIILL